MDEIEALQRELDEANKEIERLRALIHDAVVTMNEIEDLTSQALSTVVDVRDDLKNE